MLLESASAQNVEWVISHRLLYDYYSTCGANKASLSKFFNLVCISQVSRSVSNFDAILPFYVDILGSTIVHQVDFEDFVE